MPDNYACVVARWGRPSISLPPTSPKFGHSFFHNGTDTTYRNTRCFGKVIPGGGKNKSIHLQSEKLTISKTALLS